MTDLNKLSGINSVDKRTVEKKVVPHVDEQQFRMLYTRKPTETWKSLDGNFAKRTELQKEKLQLKIEKHDLIEQHHKLSKDLEKVMAEPARTPEEQRSKMAKIKSIKDEQRKIVEKVKEKDKEIEKKTKKIENLDIEINNLAEKIREEEHDENNKNKEELQKLNEKRIEDLKSQL